MRIDRLEVSGGFLDGLKLPFANGLNVLIGARGAGKTSILELIRYGLGIPAMTSDAEKAARSQALAVLADGAVSVFCAVGERPLVFTRSGLDEAPAVSAPHAYAPPLLVSQNEIEAIGLNPPSRREMLDRLIDADEWRQASLADTPAETATLQRRLESLRQERDELATRAAGADELARQLEEAEKEQAVFAKAVAKTKPLQKEIAEVSDELGNVRAAAEAYRIAEESIHDWRKDIKGAAVDRSLPRLRSAALEAALTDSTRTVHEHLDAALKELDGLKRKLAKERVSENAKQGKLQTKLTERAERLDEVQKGAGELGRRVSALRQQLKEHEGQSKRVNQLDEEIAKLVAARERALDEGEERSKARYQLRADTAAEATRRFHGRIEVRVERSGELADYEAALVGLLQGSNLQYKPLAAILAEHLSPRELLTLLEDSDSDGIASATKITKDRAARVIAHLQGKQVASLLLAPLEDSVDFALLDGTEYKPTRQLSMGQRCTVVLPLLLAAAHESIVLDQPEDHLDNAFVVDTLVQAIRDRVVDGQVLVATHNANVPVLGDAQNVIVLKSDGRHGFVATSGPLEQPDVVQSITTLMEGGAEAFAKRAAFYSQHSNDG
jgi:murein DD-endopeptidase MepM/ murein hydrolase activator NlpD